MKLFIQFSIFFILFILSFILIFIIHNRKNFNKDSLKFTIFKFTLLLLCIGILVASIITGIKWFLEVL